MIWSSRLLLRHPVAPDAPRLSALLNNLNVTKWLGRVPHPYAPQDALAFIGHVSKQGPDALNFVIVRQSDHAMLGGAGIVGNELGYWIAEPFWKQGFATEASAALVDYAFASASHRNLLTASYWQDNHGSARVLRKLGFEDRGQVRLHSMATGLDHDSTEAVLSRDRWSQMKKGGTLATLVKTRPGL